MTVDSSRLQTLVSVALDGVATDEQRQELNQVLRADAAARDLFLQCADLHACLSVDEQAWVELPVRIESVRIGFLRRPRLLASLAATSLIVLGIVIAITKPFSPALHGDHPRPIATVSDLTDTRWVSPTARVRVGDSIVGGHRFEISSGSATLAYASGTKLKLIGPAILDILTENSVFLLLGHAAVTVDTPRSRGFVLQTRTSHFIDIGTSFVASASVDGQSRVDVSRGRVDVGLNGIETLLHLKAGDALCIEPGERQIMTRIESGDETAAFRFPTIEPPSTDDYADISRHHATIRVLQGKLFSGRGASGPVDVLLDGRGQAREDAPEASAFFPDSESGSFLMDLGKPVTITKINTYSWHQNTTHKAQRHRAAQKYTLFAFAGSTPPSTEGDLTESGWVRLARVNSDDYFRVADPLDRPAQQACSITAGRGSIGTYRYLVWQVESTLGWHTKQTNNTFYGEFDVYTDHISGTERPDSETSGHAAIERTE